MKIQRSTNLGNVSAKTETLAAAALAALERIATLSGRALIVEPRS